jgi:oligo-alginate lyase
LSHGHFDKLSFLFYDQQREIIQDYGAARFLNVEQKAGGRYLPENKSFSLQTIAHNTVVVDEKSNFNGKQEVSQKHYPERYFFNIDNPDFQYASAKDDKAYNGVSMHRTFVMVNDDELLRPVIIDVFRINSENEHQYDLPFYYMGHFISTNFDYQPYLNERRVLGKENGYQHLWKTAEGKPTGTSTFTWLNGERYYSITSNTDPETEIILTQIGANDPNFNLRNDEAIMFRRTDSDHVFASIIEPHGAFNPTLEYSFNSYSTFEKINVLKADDEYTIVQIEGKDNLNWILLIVNNDASETVNHKLTIKGEEFEWKGPIHLVKN